MTHRPQRWAAHRWAWTGLLPFFALVFVGFIVPIGFVLVTAFQVTSTTVGGRDPVTQQFVTTSSTSFSFANIAASLQGVFLTGLWSSIQLSLITAALALALGLLLAYAVTTSRSGFLRSVMSAGAAVTANFGGVPLAFLFIATLDANSGAFTLFLKSTFNVSITDLGFRLQSLGGIALVYMYFLIPMMVLVITPALEGTKPQWAEAAENLGATRVQYWLRVAGPVLLPNLLGSFLLLFCSAFSAVATAAAIDHSFPLITSQILARFSGNVEADATNLAAALALNMVIIVLPFTLVYLWLERRTARWFG